MNINIQYIVKFWDYLRKLFKPEGEDVLLSKKYTELPEYSVTKIAFKNNIAQATNVDFISPYTFDEGSGSVRDSVVPQSGQVRQSFGGSSTAVRQFVEGQSKRSRTAPEQDSKPSRTRVEADSNNSRTSVEENLSNFEHLTPGAKNRDAVKDRFVPAPNQVLTLFYRRPSLQRSCTVDVPSLHREKGGAPVAQVLCRDSETYNKVKSRLKQSPNKVSTKVNEKEPKLETSVFSLTSFTPTSTFLQVGFESALGRLRVNSMNTRMRLEANSNEGIRRIGESINLIFRLFTIVVQWLCLKTMLMLPMAHKIGTEDVLESYPRGTADGRSAEHSDASISLLSDSNSQSVDQACVKQCICIDQVWIVRKTVPIHALSTLYLCFIYASSILNPYFKDALSQIRTSKTFNFISGVRVWLCVNNPLGRLKHFLNKMLDCWYDAVVEPVVQVLRKSTSIQRAFTSVYQAVYVSFKSLLSVKTISLFVLMVSMFSLSAQTPRKDSGAAGLFTLQGTVVSAVDGKPLEGVSVRGEVDKWKTSTKKDGSFSIAVPQRTGKLKLTYVGYKTQDLDYAVGVMLRVQLISVENQLDEVEVVSTGYQNIPKERATGSFEFVDNKLFNRKVSTDFVSRLEDIVPGLSSVKYFSNNRGNLLNINIRGESTLRSEKWPLVVIDGVPYESRFGDLGFGTFNNINPNDVESVTVLKDAAAASIWGAKAGNGVIVITTKKAKFNERTNISFNSNVSIKNRPDLYTYPQMPTSDYIDLVQQLFNAGRYNSDLNYFGSNPEPIVWLMKDYRDNKISDLELKSRLDQLRGIDMRDDFMQYIYRKTINQQYSLRLNAGGEKVNTSIGIGYDKNLEELVTSDYNRMNLQSNTQFKPVDRLLIDLGITYTESKKNKSFLPVGYNALAKGFSNYPYMQLADDLGNPVNIDIASFNPAFRDTVANGRLQDWTYNPLKELYDSKQTQRNRDLMVNLSLKYSFPFGLTVGGLYAYQHNDNPITEWRGIGTFLQRDQINMFSSWDAKQVYWNMPVGDYQQDYIWNSTAHQGRLTAEYQRKWNKHDISLLAGYDIRSMDKELRVAQYYGYDPENGTFKPMHLGKEVPYLNGMFGTNTLPDQNNFQALYNRFVSYYGNGAYTYNDRYIISASFRKDASNLFGVKANDKGQPFWSIGGAWLVSKESFIDDRIFTLLKLRATYGYNGNVNTGVSAYPIMSISSNPNSITGQNYAQISTPPNPKLRWERVGNLNLGLDFALKGNILSGSIEYYRKTPKDLVAPGQLDPTAGFTSLTMNTANLDTRGWDVSLNIRPISRKNWEWNSNLVFANSRTVVTKAFLPTDLAWLNIGHELAVSRTAIEGMNLYSLLTYKWAGLDPENGTPRAYLNGEISKDYFAITGAPVSSLENHGSQIPVYFGSLRNSVRYKDFEFSWNISYQLGHKFIRSSFYNDTFLDLGFGHPDYALRWQKPGDELITDVPAFTYPNNATGSQVYKSSSIMVENAGQIKLRDIQCSLALPKLARYGLKNVRIYTYFQNIGTIWRGNKKGIDPEFGNWVPDPLMCSFGLNFNL